MPLIPRLLKRFWLPLTLLCVVGAIALYVQKSLQDSRIKRENQSFDKIWTVEIVGSEQSYKFRSALGTFFIHKSHDIDAMNKTVSGMGWVNFRWAYPGGEPWPLWKTDNPDSKLRNQLTVKVSVIKPGIDAAANAKWGFLDRRMKSTNPSEVPKYQKMVWNGEAALYRQFGRTIYLIEKREPMDVRVIACWDSSAYCSMHGAMLTKWLTLKHILIPQDRVSEWKQYQQRTRELVNSAMVKN